jgi:hypothetical protein
MKKHYQINYNLDDNDPIYLMNGERKDFLLRTSSLDKGWSKPGQVLLSLKDTGNGLIITTEDRSILLNYMEAEMLRLALKINQPEVGLSEVTKKAIK